MMKSINFDTINPQKNVEIHGKWTLTENQTFEVKLPKMEEFLTYKLYGYAYVVTVTFPTPKFSPRIFNFHQDDFPKNSRIPPLLKATF